MNTILKTLMENVKFVLFLFFSAVTIPNAFADDVDGACGNYPPTEVVLALRSGSFSSNKAGAKVSIDWDLGSFMTYEMDCYFKEEPINGVGLQYARVDALTGTPSGINSGFYKLTEDLDYRLVFYNMGVNNFPFRNEQVGAYLGGGGQGHVTVSTSYFSGGFMEFILRRDIIGGALAIPGSKLFNLFWSVNSDQWASSPIYEASVLPTIIPITSICEVNDGQTVEVKFGNVTNTHIANSFSASVNNVDTTLAYACTTTLTQDIDIQFIGEATSFDTNALKVGNNGDIGIVMSSNNKMIPPGQSLHTKLVNGQGSDTVRFSVIKNPAVDGKDVATGAFSASATLVLTTA